MRDPANAELRSGDGGHRATPLWLLDLVDVLAVAALLLTLAIASLR